MDLKLVDCFLRVVEAGSINKAALDMEITQPALSRRLNALEHDLGIQLLVREARGVKLTEAGTLLYNGARPLLRQAELLRDKLGREARAQVSIGLPFSMHRLITAPFASAEIQSRSAVSLRIYEGFIHHLREWQQQGLVDVAIMDFEEGTSPLHEQTPLVREPLLLVGPVDAALHPDRPASAEKLGACKLILPGRPNLVRKTVDSYLKRHGQKFRRAADAETLQLCLSLVKDGLGYTVMPYCAMHDFPQMSELSATPIKGLTITWSLYVSQARRHSAGVRSTALSLQRMMLGLVERGEWPLAQAVAASPAGAAARRG